MDNIDSGFAETARGRVYFEVSGPANAPALIFFGLSTSKGFMAEITRGYRERLEPHYRFLVCDYPVGNGASERREDAPPMTPSQVATDYIAVADAAGFARFACAGYSYGANTSLQLAMRHPERLTALVVGGWPALGGDFKAALSVCKRQRDTIPDASSAMSAVNEDFIAYYESLQDWDDRQAAESVRMPRLNFVEGQDLGYPGLGVEIDIGPAVVRNQSQLRAMGWETHILNTDVAVDGRHIAALQPEVVAPLLHDFLKNVLPANA